MKKRLIYIISIFIFLFLISPKITLAKTLQDMYNELANLQAQFNENKNKRDLTQNEINKLNNEIEEITNTIEKTREEIKITEQDIENSKIKIEEKKVETDGLLQFLQVTNGGNIYLEYLFDAENYTDFIYRYEVVKQLTNYNSDLIDELETLIIELQEKEKELEEKNIKLENNRKELSKRVSTLTNNLTNFKAEGVDIEKDIASIKKEIKIYEDRGCTRNQDLSTCIVTVTATGWKYPLAKGCVTSEYTGFNKRTDWSGAVSGHHAIDLDCVGEGTPIYAAADGVVTRIDNFEKCGGNTVFILHRINGKQYTTEYMHLLRFANDLYVHKVVTDNTIIGYVGGYSTAKGHGGKDECTTGAHLHFGMAEGDSAYSFNSHSFNPREIFSFPKLVWNGGGYFYR